MNPGSSTDSYPAFAHIGLRENPEKTSTRFWPLELNYEAHPENNDDDDNGDVDYGNASAVRERGQCKKDEIAEIVHNMLKVGVLNSEFIMPKTKINIEVKLKQYVSQYGEKVFSTDGTVLYCQLCSVKVAAEKKFTVEQHVNRDKQSVDFNVFSRKKISSSYFWGTLLENGALDMPCACMSQSCRGSAKSVSDGRPTYQQCKERVCEGTVKRASFKAMAPGVPMPPAPILTRWGTWIEACVYYSEYFKCVKEVVDSFDSGDAVSIRIA
ncbi:hypothetical protein ANN_26322 [Periplaneta americana]|uniref:Uncharacterized protein n=1 Tax=Periplaneta americana TaxID=6978 RepID=A0ABQ8S5W4_PERAM|nr:hypothetical protein ANN_26322 [Periplaneta americana]